MISSESNGVPKHPQQESLEEQLVVSDTLSSTRYLPHCTANCIDYGCGLKRSLSNHLSSETTQDNHYPHQANLAYVQALDGLVMIQVWGC